MNMEETTTQPDGNELLKLALEELLKEAKNDEFSDFKNDKYATPKMELIKKLTDLIKATQDGMYDD